MVQLWAHTLMAALQDTHMYIHTIIHAFILALICWRSYGGTGRSWLRQGLPLCVLACMHTKINLNARLEHSCIHVCCRRGETETNTHSCIMCVCVYVYIYTHIHHIHKHVIHADILQREVLRSETNPHSYMCILIHISHTQRLIRLHVLQREVRRADALASNTESSQRPRVSTNIYFYTYTRIYTRECIDW
jgi:hypothetical protein